MTRCMAVLSVCLAAAVAAIGPGASNAASFPHRIELPRGFQPEGVAVSGSRFYVGSIPTGAVYRGSVITGRGSVLVPPHAGRAAVGVEVANGQIFVAGGPTGSAFVYDAATGADVAAFDLAATSDTFVNDVVVTENAAWFTDSRQPVLYRVALGAGGKASAGSAVSRVPFGGDIRYQPGFNVNGIDALPGSGTLVIVQSNTGQLFTVAAATGATRRIDLGGESVRNGDGILLRDTGFVTLLYVVQNQDNTIAKLSLARDLSWARLLGRIRNAGFDVPTTADLFARDLVVVNARFGTPATPRTRYWLTRVRS